MKKNIFRPVEFWKSTVMTMPDSSFYELVRSVFGKIKTPFTKQQLLNDLEIFLLREDIQRTIADYIDGNDAKIITAVALFKEPAPGELESFFTGELSYAQLQDIIVNLEERFILYRFTEDKKSRLALNPVLEQILLPITADIGALFPAVPETEAAVSSAPKANRVILNDRILAGLLSFACQWESFYRAENVVRKRVIEAGKLIFPGIDLAQILGSLQILGLFYTDEYRIVPDKKCFDDFGSLSTRERSEYCASALLVYNEMKSQTEILPPLFRSRIRETVIFIHSFLDFLDTKLLYSEKTLIRLTEILRAETGLEINCGALFEALEMTGLLVKASVELRQLGETAHNKVADYNGPLIAIDSGSSILVYPEIDFSDAVSLASVLNIREAGAVVRFELDRDSAVRSFDENVNTDEIIELLERLSGEKVDDALIWNLKDWEKRYGEVSLKKGVILNLCEDRRYLTETFPLAQFIIETLAPGVYLLADDAMNAAENALRGAGIDIIARRNVKVKSTVPMVNHFFSLTSHSLPEEITATDTKTIFRTNSRAAAITAGFHAILEKMPMGETEKSELSARIDRRLVLCEAQLKDANLRYEKLEARRLDYAGKQNIAKQAISQHSPVEIIWPGGGREESIFGIPHALEKEGGELILTLVPAEKEDVMRIPLAKISLLRRIKKSIFEI